ncbi:MAG TPA: stage III sporulation protein AG [Candidatus Blautia pullicola]|uniref:Stage III sporulation protein AG n=1 Tax=Candidatus Blautia pullicola TaxID=2838498 RepID=A0A9D2FSU5_9FIRM|nr:stage III sporulation protein AG [Candidatus Blautia pullicola]
MKPLEKVLKKENLAVLLLAGLLLLIIALPVKNSGQEEEEKTTAVSEETSFRDWQSIMEEKLKLALEQVEGIGKTQVFLTCEGTETKVVEKDESQTVYEKDAKGNQSPYVASEVYPKVIGVVVVAQGGDNPVVIQNIQEACQVLFQVEAHKIKVMKMN